jgi:hypothetical protein
MARSNGAISALYLNNDGGDVVVGGALDVGHQVVTVVSSTENATALCPAGSMVLGGGCDCGADLVEASLPNVGGTGWICECDGINLTARAICMRVK